MATLNTQDLEGVLLLIEEAHKAKSPQELRQSVVYGVGALMESVSCAWTELSTDLVQTKPATTTAVNVDDDEMDVEQSLILFNQYVWQHPVVRYFANNECTKAHSISDILTQSEFKNLELYRYVFKILSVEDQLSVGYVENSNVKGLSVNRATWGFTQRERNLLMHVYRGVFPFYKQLLLSTEQRTSQEFLIEASINSIGIHYDVIGITARQAELLTLVAQGKSNKQIALLANISEGTVRKHLENIFSQLGVNNRVSATIKSMKIIQQAMGKQS